MKNEKLQKRRGRPNLIHKSIPISVRFSFDLYQKIEREKQRIQKELNCKISYAQVLQGLVEKHL